MVVYLTCFSLTLILKGTVSVILSEPPCKDDIARFITLHLKALIIEQLGSWYENSYSYSSSPGPDAEH